jgi:hypothetical protein
MIIGLLGLINSGKGAVSDYICQIDNFKKISLADSLKEAISVIFGWPLELLLGKTKESREWRDKVDPWWSKRLNIPNLTPRFVLQKFGTEACRNHFHQDIWLASLENKLSTEEGNIIIDDLRFSNEITSIRNLGGIIIKVQRGPNPEWYSSALRDLNYIRDFGVDTGFESFMEIKYPEVHVSEWGWINQKFDYIIKNDSTIDDLHIQVDNLIKKLKI